ncbi:glycosyltransferase family 2 protein [Acetobacter nitrogenifigens]|uniref:Glycosyl transferase n=1 Tax=Acetobacter nitrogenifigens DSM 23921 = NBRC 105050 TaxID=1120919 RepID=A0A511XB01_9PROT|nr:glycosyltransferase family 2 protein [Acetobacter nitrogenifigens]GEN60105.1 glycosyl transferase [Acetobacter nitrogenifigens DSM 23921 = NBRC 105050]
MVDNLSLVVPFYNEEEGIDFFSKTISSTLAKIPSSEWELICVDDGSSDKTLQKLIDLSLSDSRFKVVELSRNFGKEAALTAGLDTASGAAVVVIDADLQDPAEIIATMVEKWREGAEVVLGRRIDRSSDSVAKRATASWFYSLHNRISKIKIPENVGDFRLMDRCVVDALKTLPEQQRFMKGLFAWVGFRTVTVDYVRAPRVSGVTKFSPFSLWNFAIEGITSFSTVPLRIWTYIGCTGALLTLLYGIFITLRTMIFGSAVPGYASIFFAITLLGSVQIISVGILGEYIGRMYMETKNRPIYIRRKIYHRID